MPRYHKLGKTPHKRHTTFKKADGGYHYEELFGTIGFDGMSSLLYPLLKQSIILLKMKNGIKRKDSPTLWEFYYLVNQVVVKLALSKLL